MVYMAISIFELADRNFNSWVDKEILIELIMVCFLTGKILEEKISC